MPAAVHVAAAGGVAAAAGWALSLVDPGTPVQKTLLGFAQYVLWAAAGACAAIAAGLYALQRYRARKANPYARLKLEREPRFDMPHLGRHAAALAVGEPLIRIRHVPRAPRPERWSLEVLQALEWKRFELLCSAYYGHRGFRPDVCGRTPDGGSEARLYYRELPQPVAMLSCKAWGSRPVGVKPLRELHGLMERSGVAKGIFHTSGDYTNEAKAYAGASRIQLVTGPELVQNLLKLPDAVQKALLDLATAGDYTTPTCPSCGEKMVMCSADHGDYWGCSAYPACKATLVVVPASW